MSEDNSGAPQPPANKSDLLQRMRAGRAALEQTLAPLDEAALEAADADGWAIKDHLAHLTDWSNASAGAIQGRPAHEGLGFDKAALAGLSEDEENALLQARSRGRPAADVLAEFRLAHTTLLGMVEELPEAKLFGTEGDKRLLGQVIGNSYEHDDEHRGWIEERMRQRAARRSAPAPGIG